MKKLLSLCLLFLSLESLSMTPEERAIRREELRRQMHHKMLNGMLDDPERIMHQMDRMMDDLLRDSLSDMEDLQRDFSQMRSLQFAPRASVRTEWSEDQSGRILKVISPNKETKMDVQVLNGVVSIKTEQNSTHYHNQMSRTQLVPGDCDGDKVKMEAKDGALVLHFPWKNKSIKPIKDERKPIQSNKQNVDV
ncbi:MAG: hypothetical protein K2P81_00160 [Bacteriovoracaceae bacterium]|nr:hypothetical protein [Bacteriovoracaceae bacterium]